MTAGPSPGESTEQPTRRLTPLIRPHEGRLMAGVCAGLGRYTGVDPVVFRVAFVVLALASGTGVLAYLVAWLLTPREDAPVPPRRCRVRHRLDGDTVLLLLAGITVLGIVMRGARGISHMTIVPLVVLGMGLLAASSQGVDILRTVRTTPERLHAYRTGVAAPATRRDGGPATTSEPSGVAVPADTPSSDAPPARDALAADGPPSPGAPPADTPPPSGTRVDLPAAPPPDDGPRPYGPATYGPDATIDLGRLPTPAPEGAPRRRGAWLPTLIVLLTTAAVAGSVFLISGGRVTSGSTRLVLAAALTTIGLGLLVVAWLGRARALVLVGALLALALAATSSLDAAAGFRVGEVTSRPTDVAEASRPIALTLGSARLDLTALPLRPGQTVQVRARVQVGELQVIVPRAAEVRVAGHVAFGEVRLDGAMRNGWAGWRFRVVHTLEPLEGPTANPPVIELDLSTGAGDIGVSRAPA